MYNMFLGLRFYQLLSTLVIYFKANIYHDVGWCSVIHLKSFTQSLDRIIDTISAGKELVLILRSNLSERYFVIFTLSSKLFLIPGYGGLIHNRSC